jgi:hypothetical protein
MDIKNITVDEHTRTIFFGGKENRFLTEMVDRNILEWNDPSLPRKLYYRNKLRHEHVRATGFVLSCGNQYIDSLGDDAYLLRPSEIGIVIQTETSPIPPGGSDTGETRQSKGIIYIKGNSFTWIGRITPHGYRLPDSLDMLKSFLHTKATKFMRRNLRSVATIGKNRELPENVEGVIGEFLSGKHGHLVAQQNALIQNLGYSLAPQVRNPKPKVEGGKRTTRKNKRQI